jgi:hypothetical protein
MARATMSVEPPGGHGTINVTGFDGNDWAVAADVDPMQTSAPINNATQYCLRMTRSSLCCSMPLPLWASLVGATRLV